MRSRDSPTGAAEISAAGEDDFSDGCLFTPLSRMFPASSLNLPFYW